MPEAEDPIDYTIPHPMNVEGSFYVGDGCCTLCMLPQILAPDMFRNTPDDDHCYVYQQPENEEQLKRMLECVNGAEFACIWRKSSDPQLRLRLIREGLGDQLVDAS